MNFQTNNNQQNLYWKYTFLLLSIFTIFIMTYLSRFYGQSGDEWLQIEYGQHIYDYFFHGNKQALDYSNKNLQYQGMEYYGGLFDYLVTLLRRGFPSVPILIFRHFFNAFFGSMMMIFTGLLTYRFSKKWGLAILSLLFIFFSPRLFGESMNNPKDIPFATGFIIAIYGFISFTIKQIKTNYKDLLLLALGFGIAFGTRPAGGLLLLALMFLFVGAYQFSQNPLNNVYNQDKKAIIKSWLIPLSLALFLGFIIGYLCWPWGLQSPVSNLFSSFKEMANRGIVLRVLFEGKYTPNNKMPWYYEFKWIFISSPIIVLFGFLMFFPLNLLALKKKAHLFIPFVIIVCALFPILYIIYKKSSVHDTWRHLFFVYPFWVIAATLSFQQLSNIIKSEKLKVLPYAIALIGLIPVISWTFKSHPNQYIYFNEIVGGVKNAFGNYDLDYYQNTGLQAANWISQNAPKQANKIRVLSNMGGFDKYFAKDSATISSDYCRYNDRHKKDWDYFVSYGRFISVEQLQNKKWPPQNIAHAIEIDQTPISVVIQRKSKASIAANTYFEAKDFKNAIPLYESYLSTDTTDENVWMNYAVALASINNLDKAVNAVNHAIDLDSGRPDFYQLAAQLYQAKGDQGNAQKASRSLQNIISEEQAEED